MNLEEYLKEYPVRTDDVVIVAELPDKNRMLLTATNLEGGGCGCCPTFMDQADLTFVARITLDQLNID